MQPTTRGKARKEDFGFTDVSLLVPRLAEEGGEEGESTGLPVH